MTSRRGTLIEDGAREFLQLHGYSVRVLPPGFHRRLPPVHLIATHLSGETRYIRIRKICRRMPTAESLDLYCPNDLAQLRRYAIGHQEPAPFRCEIWAYSLTHGFRCFEIGKDTIREIPKLPLSVPADSRSRGVA